MKLPQSPKRSDDWLDNFELWFLSCTHFPIQKFPLELLLDVIKHLPSRDDVDRCKLVCSKWHDLVDLNPSTLKQRHEIDVVLDGESGPNFAMFIDFNRNEEERTIRLSRHHPSRKKFPYFEMSIIRSLSFHVYSQTSLEQFEEDLKAMHELGGGRMLVKEFTLKLSGTVMKNMIRIKDNFSKHVDASHLNLKMELNYARFSEWISDKPEETLRFATAKHLSLVLDRDPNEDNWIDWGYDWTKPFEDFILSPIIKRHIRLIIRSPQQEKMLKFIATSLNRLTNMDYWFDLIDMDRYSHHHQGDEINYAESLSRYEFCYEGTIYNNDWANLSGYAGSTCRVYRLYHRNGAFALEARIQRSGSGCQLKCLDLRS